jgi:hypothetical protein
MWGSIIAALIAAIGTGVSAGVSSKSQKDTLAGAQNEARTLSEKQRAEQLGIFQEVSAEDRRRYDENLKLEKQKVRAQMMANFANTMNTQLGTNSAFQANTVLQRI